MKIHCSHFRSLNLIYEEVQPKITLEDCPPGGLSLWRTVPLEDRLPGGLSLEGCPPGELSLEGCPGGGPAARRIVPWRPWRTVLVEGCPAGGLPCWRTVLVEDRPGGGPSWWRTVLVEECPGGGLSWWRDVLLEDWLAGGLSPGALTANLLEPLHICSPTWCSLVG